MIMDHNYIHKRRIINGIEKKASLISKLLMKHVKGIDIKDIYEIYFYLKDKLERMEDDLEDGEND